MRLFGVDAGRQGGGACQPTVPMPQFILGREAEQGGGESAPLFPAFLRLFSAYSKILGKSAFHPLISAYFSAYFYFLNNLRDLCFFPPEIFQFFFPTGKSCPGLVFFLGVFFSPTQRKNFSKKLNLFSCFYKKDFDHLEEKTCKV